MKSIFFREPIYYWYYGGMVVVLVYYEHNELFLQYQVIYCY